MTSNDSGNDLRSRIARSGFATLLIIGLMALSLVAAGCGGDDTADSGTDSGATAAQTESTGEDAGDTGDTAVDEDAKNTFTSTCGGCHVLADADTKGSTGPNLDDLKPDAARVEKAIKNGGASGTTMPKELLKGEEATAVSEYVASVAGK